MPSIVVIIGFLLITGGRVYTTFWHPEWTDPTAFQRLWWIWLLAIALVAGGFSWSIWRND